MTEAPLFVTKYKGAGAKLGIEYATAVFNNFVLTELNDNQRWAVISFIENRGTPDFLRSKLLRIINEDEYEGWEFRAAEEFLNPPWSRWKGRLNKSMNIRRNKERALFLKPILVAHNIGVKK